MLRIYPQKSSKIYQIIFLCEHFLNFASSPEGKQHEQMVGQDQFSIEANKRKMENERI